MAAMKSSTDTKVDGKIRDPAGEEWHLDKRVPIALILAILGQTVGAFTWAAKVDARLAYIERQQTDTRDYGERLIRLEEQGNQNKELLTDIRDRLQRRDEVD